MILPTTLTAIFETMLNQALKMDPQTKKRFADLEGKVIMLEFSDINMGLALIPGQQNVTILAHFQEQPDTVLRGSSVALAGLSTLNRKNKAAIISGTIEIDGDVELGQYVKDIFADISLDWEPFLSAILGKNLAQQATNVSCKTKNWFTRKQDQLQDNVIKWLHDSKSLPDRHDVDALFHGINSLTLCADQIEQRICHLQSILNKDNKINKMCNNGSVAHNQIVAK